MRVLVVGSCGKKKLHTSPKQPTCRDISGPHNIHHWREKFLPSCAQVRDMYLGPQNSEIVKAVDLLRTIHNVNVQLVIISAGFGLLEEEELVPPYDCSFTNMGMVEIRKRSDELRIPDSFAHLVNSGFDLIFLALGRRYLASLGKDISSILRTPTVTFHKLGSDFSIRIPCATETVKAFSMRGHKIHGVVGFKGDLLRVLAQYALETPNPECEIQEWTDLKYLRSLVFQLGGLENSDE